MKKKMRMLLREIDVGKLTVTGEGRKTLEGRKIKTKGVGLPVPALLLRPVSMHVMAGCWFKCVCTHVPHARHKEITRRVCVVKLRTYAKNCSSLEELSEFAQR
jgi:hypothetical protein